jgi:RNA polymerase sigma factor (TIGR02999 family)
MPETPRARQLVPHLLKEWTGGKKQAPDGLMPIVCQHLRKLAFVCLRSERPDHTLTATALVHETYLRLVDADLAWENRAHFLAVSAHRFGRTLVGPAKANPRQKRGGGAETISLDEAVMIEPQTPGGIMDLDAALQRPAAHDPRKSEIIEPLCFGGLTYEETAAAFKVSPATEHRELKMARAWLHRELTQDSASA